MNASIIVSPGSLLALAVSLVMLVQCEDKPQPDPPDRQPDSEAVAGDASKPSGKPARPLLEDIITGVWESSNPEKLEQLSSAPEKIQIDFRSNGEATLIIYGSDYQKEGEYEVKGDELKLRFHGEEEDAVKTKFDGKTLTVIEVASGDEVEFQKL